MPKEKARSMSENDVAKVLTSIVDKLDSRMEGLSNRMSQISKDLTETTTKFDIYAERVDRHISISEKRDRETELKIKEQDSLLSVIMANQDRRIEEKKKDQKMSLRIIKYIFCSSLAGIVIGIAIVNHEVALEMFKSLLNVSAKKM